MSEIESRIMPLRWSSYFLAKGVEFNEFWREYLNSNSRDMLFILALGFDPRMCHGLEEILKLGGNGKRNCIILELNEGEDSPSLRYQNLIDENSKAISELIPESNTLSRALLFRSEDGRRVGSTNAMNIIDIEDISEYTDIVLDISSMPVSIFFPLVGKVISLVDSLKEEGKKSPNIHVIVSKNASLDNRIISEGVDEEASYMHGFIGVIDTEAVAESPKVWIPVLGPRQEQQLARIYELINPNEMCPMLPMPSTNPRQVEDLLLEYRELLLERYVVQPRDIIYAAEDNPFNAYREIGRTVLYYNKTLSPIGSCQVIISALSSKLLAIGAMLAAYELKSKGLGVGIAHIESQGFRIEGAIDRAQEIAKSELVSIWLAGDCYEH